MSVRMTQLVPPHGGGQLRALLVPDDERAAHIARAQTLKKLDITSREGET